jgi:ABC-type nitrate/sulfonate/bicarbonate transport system ATPase subunit
VAVVLFPWRSVLDSVLLPIDVQRLGRERYSATSTRQRADHRGAGRVRPVGLEGSGDDRANLGRFTIDRLMTILARLDQHAQVRVTVRAQRQDGAHAHA